MSNTISIIQKSLKVRLYPTPQQEIILNKTFGCCRLLYNERLSEHINWWNQNKDLDKSERSKFRGKLPKQLREEKFSFLSEDTIAEALLNAQQNCEAAYSNFFKSISGKRKGKKIGTPRFKKKSDHRDSFSVYMFYHNPLDFDHRSVFIPKLKETKFASANHNNYIDWFKEATPKHMTVSKNPAGEYWCSILFEKQQDININIKLSKSIGLDFSPNSLYISDLNEEAPGYIPQKQNHKKQLTHLQRNLARKQKDSENREKVRVKLARLEEHIANCRQDYIEKETLRLVKQFDIIGIEDLNLIGLIRGSRNAKNYVDTSWSTFVNKLIWKSQFNNCIVVQSNRFYPSSKTCHNCGYVNRDLTLKDRVWTCPNCGKTIIRDQNAAINLKNNAKSILCKDLANFLGMEHTEVMSVEDMEVYFTNGELCGVSYETERSNCEVDQEAFCFS